MTDRKKEIIIKTLIVIGNVLGFMIFPGCFLIVWIFKDEFIARRVFFAIVNAFIFVGILFIIALPVLGRIKSKPVKAEKLAFNYYSYEQFIQFLNNKLLYDGYIKQEKITLDNDRELILYLKPVKRSRIDCFTIIREIELTEKLIDEANDNITHILTKYYGGRTIRDTVNMISIFCVDRVSPSFQKLLNSNLEQGLKNGRLLAGISFGRNNIYIARQEGGYAIDKYKQMRKYLYEILELPLE